jgi:hypothetical protein
MATWNTTIFKDNSAIEGFTCDTTKGYRIDSSGNCVDANGNVGWEDDPNTPSGTSYSTTSITSGKSSTSTSGQSSTSTSGQSSTSKSENNCKADPNDPGCEEIPPKNDIKEYYNSLKQKFDINTLRALIAEVFKAIPHGSAAVKTAVAELVTRFYYNDLNTADATFAKNTIAEQMQRFFGIPVAYWVAINWWYVLNYTNFTFNFMDFLKLSIFRVAYYIVEPSFIVLETLNYYLLSMRMDANISCTAKERFNLMWDWRPVTFSLFMMLMGGVFHGLPITDTVGDIIAGNPNPITSMVFIYTIFMFVYLTCTCMSRLMSFTNLLGNILIVIFNICAKSHWLSLS